MERRGAVSALEENEAEERDRSWEWAGSDVKESDQGRPREKLTVE